MTLDDLLRLEQQMSARPWNCDTDGLGTWLNSLSRPQPIAKMGSSTALPTTENARGIAASRNVFRELVEVAKAAQQYLDDGYAISQDHLHAALARLAARLEEMG